MEDFDVIVAGGGPAGSTTAGFLTRMGRRVLLLERDRFPRHHIGESMIASTFDILAEIGLEPKIEAAGFPVKSGGCFIWGESDIPWCIRFDEIPGRPTSFQVKRDVFDKILLDHVAEMGADVRQEARVTEVLREGERPVGVRYEHDGATHEARARVLVDATGLAAVIAQGMTTREPAAELKNMALYGYWTGSHPAPAELGGDIRPDDRNNIIIKMLDTGWLWFIPLGFGDIISVGYVTQVDRLPRGAGRAGLEEHYRQRVASSDEFTYLLSNSEYTGDFHTVRDWSYRSSRMAGPGFFTVGDAACFVDPILSSGVYLAVLFAKMCAVGVNTTLESPGRETMVGEWYEGLYSDSFNDYLEMARLWYHGDRKVQSWMHKARDQLGSEAAAEFIEDDRSSFVGLATGNAHTHPNYVLLRQLSSFPVPVHLRKDSRSGFHKEAHTALIAHADADTLEPDEAAARETAQIGMASSARRRTALAALLAAQPDPVPSLAPGNGHTQPEAAATLGLDPDARLSLEVLDDRVEMVLTVNGQRRVLSEPEQDVLRRLFAGSTPQDLDGSDAAFAQELLAAGALTGSEP